MSLILRPSATLSDPPVDPLPERLGDLATAALAVLGTADARAKAALSRSVAAAWAGGVLQDAGSAVDPPLRPARPARPLLLPPARMPKRGAGGVGGRIALLHAVAHIELNAIDLAWDLVARFGVGCGVPRAFLDDWVAIGGEEGTHFLLLADRLAELGAGYGDLPAHDGLWAAAAATTADLCTRLAVVPLVFEARGLDVTPAMRARLDRAGDCASAAVLGRIHDDEIGHVAAGWRWFSWACARSGAEPEATWRGLVDRHVPGAVRPPFDTAGRAAAGLPPALGGAA